jgi:hypothetical protein
MGKRMDLYAKNVKTNMYHKSPAGVGGGAGEDQLKRSSENEI